MEFEYDPEKSEANRIKHGIDFDEAQALWSDPFLIEAPTLTEDEPRFIAVVAAGIEMEVRTQKVDTALH